MTHNEIAQLLAEGNAAYGSSNPSVLGDMLDRVIKAFEEFLVAHQSQGEQNGLLKAKVFGASSERIKHAEQHLDESATPDPIQSILTAA